MRALRLLLALAVLPAWAPSSPGAGKDTIVVGSKNFAESRLLAEIFARLIEFRTELTVERRFNLAGTQVCFEALRTGAIDLYPEYTGTGLVSILGESPGGEADSTREVVAREFRERWDLIWLDPLGFENAYEIAVPSEIADAESLWTLSDLTRVAETLRAGFGYEFIEREDGLPGLERAYGLRFRDVKAMQQALKYGAAGAREIDVLDVYTTDGRLLVHDLTVLEDDRGFFPPYEAAPLVRGEILDRRPEVGEALALLAHTLSEETMRGLNLLLQVEAEPVERVAQEALEDLGLVGDEAVEAVSSRGMSFPDYVWARREDILDRALEHLGLTVSALLLGVVVAVPMGVALTRAPRVAEPVIRSVGMTQTIPSIALLAFMIPLFRVGTLPAVVALWIYSLFPILRNTYSGLRNVDPRAVESAVALGMTPRQVLRWVRLPLAAPVLMAGIRTAAVITVGTATLAAFIGAGGLGVPIVSGLQMADNQLILSGAVPAAVLAVVVDLVLAGVERGLRPRGMEAKL